MLNEIVRKVELEKRLSSLALAAFVVSDLRRDGLLR
jgi:hypothetical protein